jgi:hypothetical protein
MTNFIYAMVTIVYALVCLTKEADQGKCSTSKSAEDSFKKRTEGELGARVLIGRKTPNESKTNNE